MSQTWYRTEPVEGSAATPALSAKLRGNFAAIDESCHGKNLLGDPTCLIWPGGDTVSAGSSFGHWNVSGGAGAQVTRQTSSSYLLAQASKAAMYPRLVYGTSATRIYQSVLQSGSFLQVLRAKAVSFSAALKQASANQARLFVYDGNSYQYSSTFTTTGSWVWVTLVVDLHATLATELTFGVESSASGNVDVDAMVAQLGAIPAQNFVPAESITGTIVLKIPGVLSTTSGPNGDGTGMDRHLFRLPAVVDDVQLVCAIAPTGSAMIIDANHDGTSMFSTKPQIATSARGGAQEPDGTYRYRCFDGRRGATLTDAELSIDIDQDDSNGVGSTVTVEVHATQFCRPLQPFCAAGEWR